MAFFNKPLAAMGGAVRKAAQPMNRPQGLGPSPKMQYKPQGMMGGRPMNPPNQMAAPALGGMMGGMMGNRSMTRPMPRIQPQPQPPMMQEPPQETVPEMPMQAPEERPQPDFRQLLGGLQGQIGGMFGGGGMRRPMPFNRGPVSPDQGIGPQEDALQQMMQRKQQFGSPMGRMNWNVG